MNVTSNLFNIYWDNSAAELWIDGAYEGSIAASTGGTITGSLGVGGSVTSSANVQAAYVYSTGSRFAPTPMCHVAAM